MLVAVALPLAMMGGAMRPGLAALSAGIGLYLGWRVVRRMKAA
jgi:hypothetical protein